jgi:hypothetical protein
MSTATTTETAGKPFAGGTASVLELRDDGTGNFKHLVKKAKERAKERPYRGDQLGGSEVLKQRLGACVEEFDNIIFDTCSNEKLVVRAACELILKSGKKNASARLRAWSGPARGRPVVFWGARCAASPVVKAPPKKKEQ